MDIFFGNISAIKSGRNIQSEEITAFKILSAIRQHCTHGDCFTPIFLSDDEMPWNMDPLLKAGWSNVTG